MLARLRPRRYSLVGLLVATCFLWASLTPGLLPRGAVFQGAVSGVSAAIGYGIGVAGLGLARFMLERELGRRPPRWVVGLLAGVVIAGTVPVFLSYRDWQRELRDLMGVDPASAWQPVVILSLTLALFVALVGLARLLAAGTRWVVRQITRVVPPRVAMVVGVALVAVLVVGLLDGVVADRFLASMDQTFKTVNQETKADTSQPTADELSGSPDSLVTWASLGRQGREFVASGPSVAQLAEFSGEPAAQPVRSYVGLDGVGSIRGEAELAVRELERAGAFEREVLAVIITTGTGWVNEDAADSLEYLYNGDTAMVSMQYSYLPSWMSFVVDQTRAREAGRELFNAVYSRWQEEPRSTRPRLVVNGESLGSFGAEAAFSGLEDLRARTDGALFVGPPFMNELWGELTEKRDEGSPQWLPVYEDGETVRFMARPSDLDRPAEPWSTPRVVYLQYASDPITWWNPDLVLRRPDWLEEERGYDVLPDTRWFPLVTFLQLTADMAVGHLAPDGHGHAFGADPVDAWAVILPPATWTDDDTARLREIIAARSRARRDEG